MITLQKHFSHLVAVLTAVALAGCVKGDQANQSADSTARNLTLAPTESTAAMKDVPAPTTERAKPAPEKKAPQPAPKPATPVVPKTLTAAAGTRVPLAASESISTRQAKPGDAFSATVGERSEEHTSELQSLTNLVCRRLLEKKKQYTTTH